MREIRPVLEAMFDGSNWTDITADVLATRPITARFGIDGNGPTDRVASAGEMVLALKNDLSNSAKKVGYYSPGHSNCRNGFGPGLRVRLSFVFGGRTYRRFEGRVPPDGIEPSTGLLNSKETLVHVMDWMEQAATHEILLPALSSDKRMDQVVDLIVQEMDIQPGAANYHHGVDVFTNVFDTTRPATRALAEFQKVAVSELGFVYLQQHWRDGETLVTDGRLARQERPLAVVPYYADVDALLLTEAGDHLTTETGERLIVDQTSEAVFSNCQVDMQVRYGANLFNRVRCVAYPRLVDTSAVVLFTLQSQPKVEAGVTTRVRGSYRDPNGGTTRVNGMDMVALDPGTDFTANSKADGTGSDLTADFTVTETYGVNGVEYEITNGAAVDGYITKLQARGKGIYLYDPVEYQVAEGASLAAMGPYNLDLNMPYQDNPLYPMLYANFLLAQYAEPAMEVEKVSYLTKDDLSALLFLTLNIGDRVRIVEDVAGVSGEFIINGMEFEVVGSHLVRFTLTPQDARLITFAELLLDTDTATLDKQLCRLGV